MLYDKDIREPLFFFLEERLGRIRIIEEKNMGGSRADVVIVTEEELIGLEIKSDADTYQRLPGQVKDYDQYFDRNIIAVGSHHAEHVAEHVPTHWGIITIDEIEGEPDFYLLRTPRENEKCSLEKKLSLLWRSELDALVSRHLKYKYEGLSKRAVVKKLLEQVDEDILNPEISALLFDRDYTALSPSLKRKYHKKGPRLHVRHIVRHAGRKRK